MTEEQRKFLSEQIEAKYQWFNRGSRFWSAAHHWSLAVSAIFSAAAALTLKLTILQATSFPLYDNREDVGALLAAVGALIAALAAVGGFARKWQANRISRGRIERLRLDLYDAESDYATLSNVLKDLIRQHDEGIVGVPLKG